MIQVSIRQMERCVVAVTGTRYKRNVVKVRVLYQKVKANAKGKGGKGKRKGKGKIRLR